jgi:hypothetical protein
MTSRVPIEIREQVLTLWLQALSRDEIAKSVEIGAGTVSAIVKSYLSRNPDFDLYREFVVTVQKAGSNINELASAIRVQRLLRTNDLSAEQVESFLRDAAVHCFRKKIDIPRFIDNINKVSCLADRTGIAVEKLSEYIQEKKMEFYSVTMDLVSKEAEKEAALRDIKRLQIQLEDLRTNLFKVQQDARTLQWRTEPFKKEQIVKVLAHIMNQWLWERCCRKILAQELAEANRKLRDSKICSESQIQK